MPVRWDSCIFQTSNNDTSKVNSLLHLHVESPQPFACRNHCDLFGKCTVAVSPFQSCGGRESEWARGTSKGCIIACGVRVCVCVCFWPRVNEFSVCLVFFQPEKCHLCSCGGWRLCEHLWGFISRLPISSLLPQWPFMPSLVCIHGQFRGSLSHVPSHAHTVLALRCFPKCQYQWLRCVDGVWFLYVVRTFYNKVHIIAFWLNGSWSDLQAMQLWI